MPIYTFRNKVTGETRDEIMPISEMEDFLEKNTDWDTVPAAPFIGDSVRQGLRKPSDGFRDVLRHIKKKHKGGKRSDYTRGINTWVIVYTLLNVPWIIKMIMASCVFNGAV